MPSFKKVTWYCTVCGQNKLQNLPCKLTDMILPIVNMDITPLVQFLIFVSYIGLVFGLSVELIGSNPLRMIWKTGEIVNPATMENKAPKENTITEETPEENTITEETPEGNSISD